MARPRTRLLRREGVRCPSCWESEAALQAGEAPPRSHASPALPPFWVTMGLALRGTASWAARRPAGEHRVCCSISRNRLMDAAPAARPGGCANETCGLIVAQRPAPSPVEDPMRLPVAWHVVQATGPGWRQPAQEHQVPMADTALRSRYERWRATLERTISERDPPASPAQSSAAAQPLP